MSASLRAGTSSDGYLQIDGADIVGITASGMAPSSGKTITANQFSSAPSFRNKIINGDFSVWQRGTTFSAVSATISFGPDRFQAYQNTASIQWAQGAFTAGQTSVPGEPTYYGSLTINSGGSTFYCGQRVEDVRTLAGKTVTLTFYCKGNAARTATVYFNQNFGSGGSTTVSTTGTANAVTIANGTWNKITTTVTLPSISGKTIGAGSFLGVFIEDISSGGFVLDLAQWQLEEGSVATPFESRPYGVELALCQRYYYRMKNGANTAYSVGAYAISTTVAYGAIKLPQTMRTTPSALEQSGTASDYIVVRCGTASSACSAVPTLISNSSPDIAYVLCTVASGLTSGYGGGIEAATANSYLGFTAEL